MPKYRVKEKSLIGNEIFEAGAEVNYDGLPSENLEPLDDEGRAKYQEYLDSNAERVKKMRDQNSESAVGDPAAFVKALAEHQGAQAEAISAGIAAGIAQAMAAMKPVDPSEAISTAISAGIAAGIAQAMAAMKPADPAATAKGKGKESLV